MDKITIQDLEVLYRVGVPDSERAHPQKLLLTLELSLDLSQAASRDELSETVDYDALSQEILQFGQGRSWKLIETVADQIAGLALRREPVKAVTVEVKKFVIPQARYVSVILQKTKT